MAEIYCFSGSGHSMAVAEYISYRLQAPITEIRNNKLKIYIDTAIVIFPVYCQNIPPVVSSFLKLLKTKNIVLIATYGRISYGNVIYEAARITDATVIAAAYVPTGHSFLNENAGFEFEKLEPIFERIKKPTSAKIPITPKNPFSDFFPAWRSRVGIKIIRTNECNGCNDCGEKCPMNAITNGITNRKCTRCLRCISVCQARALKTKKSSILNMYLGKKKKHDFVLYL